MNMIQKKINWILEKMGFQLCDNFEDSDLVLVNTCSVRHSAEDKVYGQLGVLKHLKEAKPDLKCGVCGCMMQKKRIKRICKRKNLKM